MNLIAIDEVWTDLAYLLFVYLEFECFSWKFQVFVYNLRLFCKFRHIASQVGATISGS